MTKTIPTGVLLRATLEGGAARVLLCDTTDMAQAAREIHNASNVCTAALGRGISAAALLAAAREERREDDDCAITMTFKGNGPAGTMVIVANGPKIKAYIDHPNITLPLRQEGKLDVGGAIGHEGRLTVVRDLGLKEPYIGQTALVSGEIAEDVAAYCAYSEQQPTLLALGVLVNDRVLSSGGLMVQPLPGCDEALLSQLELRAPVFQDISQHLLETPAEDLLPMLFRGLSPEILSKEPLMYQCDCSRERMEKALISLGREELDDLIKTEHGAEMTCHFCRAQHTFTEVDLCRLLQEATH